MLPPVHEKLLVPFPPVIPFAVAVPSDNPLQLTLSILIDPIANTSGSVIVIVVMTVQLFTSAMVTLYTPAIRLLIV